MSSISKVNYEDLVRQVLIEIRANQTQKSLSLTLGYSFNQWHKWESGEKVLSWLEFIKILDLFKINITPTLALITKNENLEITNPHLILQDIFETYSGKDQSFIAKKLSISKSSLNRNLSSNKNVPAYLIFQALGEFSSTMFLFVESIVGKRNIKKFEKSIEQTQMQMALESEYPWFSVIEAFIETKPYIELKKHSSKFVAKYLNLPLDVVEFSLDKLEKNDSIQFVDGKYVLNTKRVDLGTSIESSAKFAKFWMQASQLRFETENSVPVSKGGWSCRVFPVSTPALEKIKELRKKFNSEFQEILQKDSTGMKEHVQVFNLNLFDSQEFPQIFANSKISKNELNQFIFRNRH